MGPSSLRKLLVSHFVQPWDRDLPSTFGSAACSTNAFRDSASFSTLQLTRCPMICFQAREWYVHSGHGDPEFVHFDNDSPVILCSASFSFLLREDFVLRTTT